MPYYHSKNSYYSWNHYVLDTICLQRNDTPEIQMTTLWRNDLHYKVEGRTV